MGKRVADVVIETLQGAGVKRCYGIVGDTLNRRNYRTRIANTLLLNNALAPSLEAAFAGGGVHLISVLDGYSENTRVLVDELRAYASPNGET
jgi:hypothetical protein